MGLALSAAAASDGGQFRSINQDAAFAAPWGAAVADGVGGGPAGDLASSVFLHRLAAALTAQLDLERLAVALRIANWDLRAQMERDSALQGMATTFTGLFVSHSGSLILAHAGDSRAYRLRDGALRRQTRDDSFVQLLVDSGVVQEADAASHPHRNLITASLRGSEADTVSIVETDAVVGDRWLLCSDGLTDYVPEPDIARVLAGGAPDAAAQALVTLGLAADSRDNVTAVVCDIVEDDLTGAAVPVVFAGSAAVRFVERLPSA